MITARTQVAAVIGWPVEHSLSPALHNAAFASLDLPWVYVALPVEQGNAAAALAAMRTLHLRGLSVTMPHKEAVAGCVDRLSDSARALRSVNTVAVDDDGSLCGHSTDGEGFLASLADAGVEVRGERVCVLGAGGAGRAIIAALAQAGAARIDVVNRTARRAAEAVALAGDRGRVAVPADIPAASLVVNTTSIGMGARPAAPEPRGEPLPCDPDALHAGQAVVDIVYHPLTTPLLAAAAQRGARVVDGLGMLVHQAAIAQRIWHGRQPDVAAMRAGALAELAKRTPVPPTVQR